MSLTARRAWHQNGPDQGRAAGRVGLCPYKGLAAYEVDDAALFYGRERLVRRLVSALVDSSLLVVSGSSGAGKSSVVRAGLLAALASGALRDSQGWEHVVVTPGRRAVDALSSLTGETFTTRLSFSSATSSSNCGQGRRHPQSELRSWTRCWA